VEGRRRAGGLQRCGEREMTTKDDASASSLAADDEKRLVSRAERPPPRAWSTLRGTRERETTSRRRATCSDERRGNGEKN